MDFWPVPRPTAKDEKYYDGVQAVDSKYGLIIMGPDGTYWGYPLSENDKINWHKIKTKKAVVNNMIAIVSDVCFKHQGLHNPQVIKDEIFKRILVYAKDGT